MFMSGLRSFVRAGVLTAGCLAVATAAHADYIDYTGLGHAAVVNTTLTVGATTYTRNVYAGEINWRWSNSTGTANATPPEGFAQTFYSYCIDLLNTLRDPQEVTVRSSEGFTNGVANGGDRAAWLFNTYAAGIRSGGTNTQAAALQVAIWEAMYDTGNSLSGGSFQLSTTGAIRTQAETYLAALYSHLPEVGQRHATVLDTRTGQDQITSRIPEPTTLLLVGCGAGLLIRRRRKAQATA